MYARALSDDLPRGQRVPDLRFGALAAPKAQPGFDPVEDARGLVAPGTPSAAAHPIPGTVAAGSYTLHQRYLIKIPDAWNGRLVVAGTPAFRSEYSNELIWGDRALAAGYAYASSNKGIAWNAVPESLLITRHRPTIYPVPFDLLSLQRFHVGYRLGALEQHPRPGIADWDDDFAHLTMFAQAFVEQTIGARPERTYAVGLSNGGAQVRALLERHGDLVDGGIDWAAPYWTPELNLLTTLPPFLRAMPAYVESRFTDAGAADAIVEAGFPPDRRQDDREHPSLWFEYYGGNVSVYNDVTLFAYALLLDPEAASLAGALGGNTGLADLANRASYVPSAQARRAIGAFAHSGRIEKPLISIAGSADVLVPPAQHAAPYLAAVRAADRADRYWQYLVWDGTHVDTFVPFGYALQPMLPFAWAAFDALVGVVERGERPGGAGAQHHVMRPDEIR